VSILKLTGAALFVAGKVKTLSGGWEFAAEVLASGTAAKKLEELAGQ
jgi:anthranilate phosphoribosyltransferase